MTDTVKLHIIDREGKKHTVDAEIGATLKDVVLKEISMLHFGDCGGCCACATCHIHVVGVKWQDKLKIKQNSLEQELIEYEPGYVEGESRLACQISLNDELNNVTVKLRDNELL